MDAEINQKPVALVAGEAVTILPEDLYIPPDALEVFLETFEGPLDLLLYLIKKQNLDVLNIPVSRITSQYMEYITIMKSMRLELAAEYLVMAAMLCEIKSRMLLPRQEESEDEEDDPRAELVRQLLEYERFKQAASDLESLPRMERDVVVAQSDCDTTTIEKPLADVSFDALIQAFRDVLLRADNFSHHQIKRESLSIRERMGNILEKLNEEGFVYFTALFQSKEGRHGLVVTFIALLELVKQSMVNIVQTDTFSPIHVSIAK